MHGEYVNRKAGPKTHWSPDPKPLVAPRPSEIHQAAVACHDLLRPRLQGLEQIPDRGRATAALPNDLAAVARHDPLSRKGLKIYPAAVAPRPLYQMTWQRSRHDRLAVTA